MLTEVSYPVNEEKRDEWITEVNRFVDEVAAWAESAGWDVSRKIVTRNEYELGEYDVPSLSLGRPGDRVYLAPVARNITGADGRFDLEAFPGLTKLAIIRRGGRWHLRTDRGVDWPKNWSCDTLLQALDLLAKAA